MQQNHPGSVPIHAPTTANNWRAIWAVIGALLVAALFVVPRTDYDDLSHDELRSYIVAGGAHHRPMDSPAQVWARVAEESPDQAMGFPLVVWLWGRTAGWSELAARTLPFLAGLLAIAMTYRLGRDLFHPWVGVAAAWVLATSIYFLTLMHYFRVFTLVALAVSLVLWCYWHVGVVQRDVSWVAAVGLVLGGVMLVYGHYFIAPFLAVVGLYHLLFAPKTRQWWVPVLLVIPVVLLFLPQVPVLLRGYALNQTKDWLLVQAASPLEIVGIVGTYFSNDAPWLLVVLLPSLVMFVRQPQQRRPLGFVLFIALGTMLAIIIMNELSGVFEPDRYRYAVGMWVPLALLAGVGVWWVARWRQLAAIGVLALWCAVGGWVTWQDDLTFSFTNSPPWRELVAPVFAHGEPDDVFLYNGRPDSRHGHYTHGIAHRPIVIGNQGEAEVDAAIGDAQRVWWGRNLNEDLERTTELIGAALDERDYVYCETYLDHPWAWLRLYAKSSAFCPGGQTLAQFGGHITLMKLEQDISEDTLTLYTGWGVAPSTALSTYSIAFVVLPAEGDVGDPVAQQDVSLGQNDGPYTPMQASLDVGNAPAGTYIVHAVVYNWQTLERLPGYVMPAQQRAPGDMVPIAQFTR